MRGASTLKRASRRRSGVGRTSMPGRLLSVRRRNSPPMTRMASAYLHQSVAALPVIADEGDGAAQVLLGWRMGHERGGFVARDFEHVGVAHDAADLQRR